MEDEVDSEGLSNVANHLAVESVSARARVAHECTEAGMSQLQAADFASGWWNFEWRLNSLRRSFLPHVPIWRGQDLNGGRILIFGEYGKGDILHFVRYASLVADRGGMPVLRVPECLRRLLLTMRGVDAVVTRPTQVLDAAWQSPLMSLPFIFRTELATIPAEIPYLRADPRDAAEWSSRLASIPMLKVGIVWAGNPIARADAERSLPLAMLQPLSRIEGVSLFSLQKGPATEQLGAIPAGMKVEDLGQAFGDFADTAAAISALDLVITVDTSVAHLAGALGVPVWILIPRWSDFRWLLKRSDSPWYPTARLFRQPAAGAWQPVIDEVALQLQEFRRTH